MKTLDEIIKRQDYVKTNTALINRAQELAVIIRKKMDELDLEELSLDGKKANTIKPCCVHSSRNGFSYEYLGIQSDGWFDDPETYFSLEDCGDYYACAGDFNCRVRGASSKLYLSFLNHAKEYINALDILESQKCDAINKALELTKDI